MVAGSGVTVSERCKQEYQKLKAKRDYKYIIFRLSPDQAEVVVDSTSACTEYEDFITSLPLNECRWAVYDLEFESKEGGKRSKIMFIAWSPDGANIKNKMVYASSKEALRRTLDGVAVEIQGTDTEEVSYRNVLEKASRGT